MAKNYRPTGQERFNFITGLIGYLIKNQYAPIDEVAKHFDVSPEYVREAIKTIWLTESVKNGEANTHYDYDFELLEDSGEIFLTSQNGFEEVPRLSGKQASAIAAGLNYLSTIPGFANQNEIAELIEILSRGSATGSVQIYDYKPGSVDADAAVIRKAILNGNRIRCEYVNQRGEKSVREIDPIRLDPRGEVWYLRGYCLIHNELRNFRLDHMRSAEELKTPICQEAKSIGEIVDAEYTVAETDIEVLVEVEPEAYSLVSDFGAEIQEQDAKTGKVRALLKVGYLPNLGRVINHYGGAAKVISPESARRVVRNYALRALGKATDDQLSED